MRRGFTLPELLVALVVLAIGLVGLAAAGAGASRLAAEGRWDMESAAAAARQLELLRSRRCVEPSFGSASLGPLTVSWALAPAGDPRFRRAYVSVTRAATIGGRVSTFAGLIACGS